MEFDLCCGLLFILEHQKNAFSKDDVAFIGPTDTIYHSVHWKSFASSVVWWWANKVVVEEQKKSGISFGARSWPTTCWNLNRKLFQGFLQFLSFSFYWFSLECSVVCDESQREFTRCFGRKVDSTRSTGEWGAHLDVSIKSEEIINLSLFIGPSSVSVFVAARSFYHRLEISNDDQRPSHVVRRGIRHLSKKECSFSFLRKFLPIYRKNSFTQIVFFLPNFLEIKVRSSSINKRREEISLISKEMILRFICYVFLAVVQQFFSFMSPFSTPNLLHTQFSRPVKRIEKR